jgi:hypothetical protein
MDVLSIRNYGDASLQACGPGEIIMQREAVAGLSDLVQ